MKALTAMTPAATKETPTYRDSTDRDAGWQGPETEIHQDGDPIPLYARKESLKQPTLPPLKRMFASEEGEDSYWGLKGQDGKKDMPLADNQPAPAAEVATGKSKEYEYLPPHGRVVRSVGAPHSPPPLLSRSWEVVIPYGSEIIRQVVLAPTEDAAFRKVVMDLSRKMNTQPGLLFSRIHRDKQYSVTPV